jgi:hypothetical protein
MDVNEHKELSNFTPRKKKANEKVNAVLHIVVTGEFIKWLMQNDQLDFK